MSLGQSLLLGALDASYTPTVNPNFYGMKHKDPNDPASPLYAADKNGNPVDLYNKPSWIQRAVSPTAREFNNANAQFGASPLIAQQSEANRMITPTYANEQNTAGAFARGGGTGITANAQLDEAMARQQLGANSVRQAATEGLLGLPEQIPMTQSSSLDLLSGRNAADLSLLPKETYNRGYNLGNQSLQLEGERAAIPGQNEELLNRSLLGAGMSGQQVEDLPIDKGTIFNQSVGGNVLSRRIPVQSYMGNLIGSNGSVSLQRDPLGRSPMQLQMDAMNSLNNAKGEVHQLPSGMSILVKPQPYEEKPTLIGDTPTMNGVPDEARQDKIDRHNKGIEAAHKADKAEVDAKMADLKKQKAQLEKEHLSSGILPNIKQIADLTSDDITGNGILNKSFKTMKHYQEASQDSTRKLIGNFGHWLYNND